jgi:hypothetical protein
MESKDMAERDLGGKSVVDTLCKIRIAWHASIWMNYEMVFRYNRFTGLDSGSDWWQFVKHVC